MASLIVGGSGSSSSAWTSRRVFWRSSVCTNGVSRAGGSATLALLADGFLTSWQIASCRGLVSSCRSQSVAGQCIVLLAAL